MIFQRLFRSGAAVRFPAAEVPAASVTEPLCLVGDLHGRMDLLGEVLRLRDARFSDHRLIVLGDMIDRGPDSAAVLHRLQQTERATCLMGNHEAMMLDWIFGREARPGRWLHNGGLETLASFGVSGLPAPGEDSRDLIARLRDAMGEDLLGWLQHLPLIWRSGNLVACHAGLDPSRAAEAHEPGALLWGSPGARALSSGVPRRLPPRSDGLWVAHGHFTHETAGMENGRIWLDTGAWASGRLGYALIDPRQPSEARVTIAMAEVGEEQK